jgi:hypothetical protein
VQYKAVALTLLFVLLGCQGGEVSSTPQNSSATNDLTTLPDDLPDGYTLELLRADHFLSGPLNSTLWGAYDGARGRTDFANLISFESDRESAIARINFDTYNNQNFFDRFVGSELRSVPRFEAKEGVIVQVRWRLASEAPGLVAQMQLIRDEVNASRTTLSLHYLTTEAKNRLEAAYWPDEPAGDPDYSDPTREATALSAGFDRSQWHTAQLRLVDGVASWWVAGESIYSRGAGFSDAPVQVALGLWAPDSDYSPAYSALLETAPNPYAAVRYALEVDWVRIYRLKEAAN